MVLTSDRPQVLIYAHAMMCHRRAPCVRACVPPNSNKGRSCVRVRVAQRMPALAQVAQLCELPRDA